MKPTSAFDQIDHPLILLAQGIIALYLFRLFFALRKSASPLPQMVGVLAFGVLANLTARSAHLRWFWAADIVQYLGLAAVVIAAVSLVNHRKVEAARMPGAAVIVADFFDRIETKAVWAFGLLIAGIVMYAYIDVYLDKQTTEVKVLSASNQAVAKATEKYVQQQAETSEKQDSILTSIASISATQGTIIANQSSNKAILLIGQTKIEKKLDRQAKRDRKASQTPVTVPPQPLTPKQQPTIPTDDEKEKNLWQRLKGLFHTAVYVDSLSSQGPIIYPDSSLVLH